MWYSASLFYSGTREATTAEDPLWEERIVLLEADGEEEAELEAKRLGIEGEHEYRAVDDVLVLWRFEGLSRLFPMLDEPKHGLEVFARYMTKAEAISLRKPLD